MPVCVIEEEVGKKQHAFWFHKDEVVIHKDWNTIGMIATASHSFEVKNLTVPSSRLFIIDASHAILPHPIYQYPFLQFAEATLAVNMAGMAILFIDLAKKILEQNKRYENKATEADHILNNTRNLFYKLIYESWNELVSNKFIQPELLSKVSNISRGLATTARRQVDELFPYCGLIAATPSSSINRVWRDLHAACLHPLLTSLDEMS
jgi:indole-3-acetate monooxygenase